MKKTNRQIAIVILIFLFNISLICTLKAMVINDKESNAPENSFIEDILNRDNELMLERMKMEHRNEMQHPPKGQKNCNTTSRQCDFFNGEALKSIQIIEKKEHVQVKSNKDFPAAQHGIITLDPKVRYEIAGQVILKDEINLNGATIFGKGQLTDQLIYEGNSKLFTGNLGGTISGLFIMSQGENTLVFKLINSSTPASLIIKNCQFFKCKNMGTIEGYAAVKMEENDYSLIENGFTFNYIEDLSLNNQRFYNSNKGTMVSFVDGSTFGSIEIRGGFFDIDPKNGNKAIYFGEKMQILKRRDIQTTFHKESNSMAGNSIKNE